MLARFNMRHNWYLQVGEIVESARASLESQRFCSAIGHQGGDGALLGVVGAMCLGLTSSPTTIPHKIPWSQSVTHHEAL